MKLVLNLGKKTALQAGMAQRGAPLDAEGLGRTVGRGGLPSSPASPFGPTAPPPTLGAARRPEARPPPRGSRWPYLRQ